MDVDRIPSPEREASDDDAVDPRVLALLRRAECLAHLLSQPQRSRVDDALIRMLAGDLDRHLDVLSDLPHDEAEDRHLAVVEHVVDAADDLR